MKGLQNGILVLIMIVVMSMGCIGIIANGSSQDIAINSVPEGAIVRIDGEIIGNTPLVADLGRSESHTVNMTMDEYEPYTAVLTKSADGGIIIADIILTGGLGLIIDLATGGLYKLNPDEVNATFGNVSMTDHALTVVMVPI